jgi:hypothetical protein
VCTVLLRYAPGARWPVLVGAVRDEFVDRSWDPPGRHWGSEGRSHLVGGRDRAAGGTWLAVDPGLGRLDEGRTDRPAKPGQTREPGRPALAALLNGPILPPPASGIRPTRGDLPLSLLATGKPPAEDRVAPYDGFHLLLASPDGVELWSWDGCVFDHRQVSPGDHILVNVGLDADVDPLVPFFRPLVARTPTPDPAPGQPSTAAWGPWLDLLAGAGLDPADPRALIVRREFGGRGYGSTSASLVALSSTGVRYDFTIDPRRPGSWYEVDLSGTPQVPAGTADAT